MKRITTQVVIIGGGATGAGIMRDCALRGIDCILLERDDIAAGTTPAIAARQLAGLIHLLRRQHPGLRIYLLSVKPSPARWLGWPQMLALNQHLQRLAASQAESRYVDLSSAMLGRNGRPRPELFMADGVHLNRAGYRLWAQLVRDAMRADQSAPLLH